MIKLQTDKGYILISGEVLTALTGDAAMGCFGVKGMVVRSMTDGLVHLLRRESMGRGVRVTYNDDGSVSLELHIAVDPGINIPVACASIMSEVRYKIEGSIGIKVRDIDVFVDSIIIG